MPVGMANDPTSFQNMINDLFKDIIDLGIVACIDDILIYSQDKREICDAHQIGTQSLPKVGLSSIDRQKRVSQIRN
jgi:hypothetical protein